MQDSECSHAQVTDPFKLKRIADVLSVFPGLHAFSASVLQHPSHIITTTGCNEQPGCLLLFDQGLPLFDQPSVTVPLQSYWLGFAAVLFSDLLYRSRGRALTSSHIGSAYREVDVSESQVLLAAGSGRGS
jgi:hypothetical protein